MDFEIINIDGDKEKNTPIDIDCSCNMVCACNVDCSCSGLSSEVDLLERD